MNENQSANCNHHPWTNIALNENVNSALCYLLFPVHRPSLLVMICWDSLVSMSNMSNKPNISMYHG